MSDRCSDVVAQSYQPAQAVRAAAADQDGRAARRPYGHATHVREEVKRWADRKRGAWKRCAMFDLRAHEFREPPRLRCVPAAPESGTHIETGAWCSPKPQP